VGEEMKIERAFSQDDTPFSEARMQPAKKDRWRVDQLSEAGRVGERTAQDKPAMDPPTPERLREERGSIA
jgi:hypothetical protein